MRKDPRRQVRKTLERIAFDTGTPTAQQVRCLEMLAKLTGMFDSTGTQEPVTVVEDV